MYQYSKLNPLFILDWEKFPLFPLELQKERIITVQYSGPQVVINGPIEGEKDSETQRHCIIGQT